MRRFIAVIVLLLALPLIVTLSQASRIDITPTGSPLGNCTVSVHSVSWFNTSGNWGTGAGQIGPGTTVHLCGTFSGSALATELTFQGNGVAGAPVTLFFEPGTVFTSTQWQAAIAAVNKNNIVIDGGTNGTIKNTASGTANGNAPGSAPGISAVYIQNGTGIEIRNLIIQNIYVHTPGATDGEYTAGILFDNGGTLANVSVHNITFNDAKKCIFFSYTTVNGVDVYSSTCQNQVWGVGLLDNNTGSTATNVKVHGMDISGFDNWYDGGFGFHYDGVIFAATNPSTSFSNGWVYDSYFHGSMDGNGTSYIYFTGSAGGMKNGMYAFDNTFIATRSVDGHGTGSGDGNITVGFSSVAGLYNNTFVSCQDRSAILIRDGGSSVSGMKGNVIEGSGGGCTPWSGVENRNYSDLSGGKVAGNLFFNLFSSRYFILGDGASYYTSLGSWQSACNCEVGSTYADPMLDSNYHPQSGSAAIGLAPNLTALSNSIGIPALASDKNGIARGATGSWDAGAYKYGAGANTPIATITPSPVSFGNQNVSSTSSSHTVTISNTGSAALTLAASSPYTLTGGNAGDFAITTITCSPGLGIAPGSSCTIGITFTPSAAGSRSTTLTINSNAAAATDTLNGTGIATSGTLSFSPASPETFGTVTVGGNNSQTITVSNIGTASVTMTTPHYTLSGTNASEFSRTGGTCADGGTIGVGLSCTITIQFAPTSAGSKTATLQINAGAATASVSLTATGAAVVVTPPAPMLQIL